MSAVKEGAEYPLVGENDLEAEIKFEEEKKKEEKERKEKERDKMEEEYEKMKAQKVDGMIDSIFKNGKVHCRLLYLTNWQANAILSDKDSCKRMILSFCGQYKPKLIIHLVHSWGFYKSTTLGHEKNYNKKYNAGIRYDTPPFETEKDMNMMMLRLNHFMSEVIIPLAERTNALILCNAITDDCVLTETLINVLRTHASRYNGEPMPFTILKILNRVEKLYRKKTATETIDKEEKIVYQKLDTQKMSDEDYKSVASDEDYESVEWTGFMEQSKNWKHRHSDKLIQHHNDLKETTKYKNDEKKWLRAHDLDWSFGNLLIVEGLDKKADRSLETNHAPPNLLLTSLLDAFDTIPSLAIKTGATPRQREKFNQLAIDTKGLAYLVDRVNSETHVICLDVRKRDDQDHITRDKEKEGRETKLIKDLFSGRKDEEEDKNTKEKIAEAESSVESLENEEIQNPTEITTAKNPEEETKEKTKTHLKYETLDCCALSYLGHKIRNEENPKKDQQKENSTEKSEKDEQENFSAEVPKKSKMKWNNKKKSTDQKTLAKLLEDERNRQNFKRKSTKKCSYLDFSYQFVEEFRNQFNDKVFDGRSTHRMASNVNALLMSDIFHCKNIWDDEKELQQYIDDNILFNYHRPDPAPCLEGLELLKSAWEYVDKTRVDADGYCRLTHVLFISQLVLAVLITTTTAVSTMLPTSAVDEEDEKNIFQKVTLGATLLLSAVVTIDSLVAPRTMWRQLRLASVELESHIWKYRAGIGKFNPGLRTTRDAEEHFDMVFKEWKNNVHTELNNVGGTMLPQNIPSLSSSVMPWFDRCFGSGGQWTSEKRVKEGADNHYSYVLSDDYLKYRVNNLIEVYQKRVPQFLLMQQKWQLTIIFLGVAIAFVTEYKFYSRPGVVLILTGLVGAVKAWAGFADIEGNMQLYPPAINALRNRQMKWLSTSKHQRQDLERFEDLVEAVEGIAVNVVESWSKSISERKHDIPVNFQSKKEKKEAKAKESDKESAEDSPV